MLAICSNNIFILQHFLDFTGFALYMLLFKSQ